MHHYQQLLLCLFLLPGSLFAQGYYEEIELVPREEITDTVITENIYYETAQYGLQVPQIRVLDKINYLAQNASSYQIDLYGYTDHHGSLSYNDSLAQRRVGTTRNYLVHRKLKPEFIAAQPLGEIPLAAGQSASPDSLHSNRRVTIQAQLTYVHQYFDTIIHQVYVPCPENDTVFVTDNGTIIQVPGCAYQEADARIRDLQYELVDAYSRSDMITNALPTLTAQNECLQTSGMIFFYARDKYDDYIFTDEGEYITGYIPTDIFEEDINLFLANYQGRRVRSWEANGEKPEQFVDPATNQKYYVFKTRGNFAINLDINTGVFQDQELTITQPNPHYKVRRYKEAQLDTYLTGERSNLEAEYFKKRQFHFSACECIPASERTVTLIAHKRKNLYVYHQPLEKVKQQKRWLFGKGNRYLIRKRDFVKINTRSEVQEYIAAN